MRKLILLTSLLVLSTGWVLAQSNDSGTGPGTSAVGSDSQSNNPSGSEFDQSNTGTSMAPQSSDTDNLGKSSSQNSSDRSGSQQGSMSGSEGSMSGSESGGQTVQGNNASDQEMGNTSSGTNTSSNEAQEETRSSSMHHGAAMGTARTVSGCLSEENGQFTLTDNAGNTYALTGKSATLKAHVGFKVRIKGKVSSGTESASSNQPGSMSGGEGETLQVTSVSHLPGTCNMRGGSSAR